MKKKILLIIFINCVIFVTSYINQKSQNQNIIEKNYLNNSYPMHLLLYNDHLFIDKEMYYPLEEMLYDAREAHLDPYIYRGYCKKKDNFLLQLTDKTISAKKINDELVYFEQTCLNDHYSGLAVDIVSSSHNQSLYKWLYYNSWRYGFVLGNEKNQFHYRYVGKIKAKEIYFNYTTLENYLKKNS